LTKELEIFIEEFIEIALNKWQELVGQQATKSYILRYSGSDSVNEKKKGGVPWKDLFLSLDEYIDEGEDTLWAVPMSLRTVETEAVLNIKD
jgi:hypothetical protein